MDAFDRTKYNYSIIDCWVRVFNLISYENYVCNLPKNAYKFAILSLQLLKKFKYEIPVSSYLH